MRRKYQLAMNTVHDVIQMFQKMYRQYKNINKE